MKRGNLWREIKNSSRRTGKQLRRKVRVARPFGIAVLVFALFVSMLRLAGGMAGKLWPYMAEMLAEIGEHSGKAMILEDKVLFRYLFYDEEDRGSFRIFSESVLNGRLYLTAASTSQADMGGQAKEEEGLPVVVEDNLAQSVLSENASWEEGAPGNPALDDMDWEDGFLDSVLSENASFGGQTGEDTSFGSQTGKGTSFGSQTEADALLDTSSEPGKTDSIFSVSVPEEEYLPVVYLPGNVTAQEKPPLEVVDTPAPTQETVSRTKILLENNYSLSELSNVNYLLSTYYIVDSITSTLPELFDANKMLAMDFTLDEPEKPEEGKYQILIYHTHASEEYIDSRIGEVMDTVRGPGEALAEYLRGYGYTVYHDMTAYDRKDGKDNRNMAYSTARPQIEAFLAEHPEVEVIIDLHRDSGAKRVATVDGKKTAQIMLFNGLCRNASGPLPDLENPNLPQNLGFSLQLNLTGRVMYPNLMFRIYLKNYRYNQHFLPRCLLVELGTDQNTLEEAYNAMKPFAAILDAVLGK